MVHALAPNVISTPSSTAAQARVEYPSTGQHTHCVPFGGGGQRQDDVPRGKAAVCAPVSSETKASAVPSLVWAMMIADTTGPMPPSPLLSSAARPAMLRPTGNSVAVGVTVSVG